MNILRMARGTSALRALSLISAVLLPTAVIADQVALKSADGTVNLVGEFVEFKDDNYVIRTALGDLRISAARVRCEGDACPSFETEGVDMKIAGSDTIGLGLMPLLMSGYASFLDAEASVAATSNEGEILASFIGDGGFGEEIGSYLVSSDQSDAAFRSLLEKNADIGMSTRRIVPAEARELKADGAGNMVSPEQEHILAVDSLVVITHPSNPIETMTFEDLREIYNGRITNWSQLGGQDATITVVSRNEGSGTRGAFEGSVFGDATPASGTSIIEAEDNNTVAATVNSDPNAIGYVGYAFQRGAKSLTLVNECGLTATPDAFSAKTEEYDLQRRLYLYTRADNTNENTSKFLDYALSEDADGVIAKAGFIDLGIRLRSQGPDSVRAQALQAAEVDNYEAGFINEMLEEMSNYDRLSTTFRFRTGVSKLDERGRLDLQRLARFLENKPAGTEVRMVGFTDDVGAFDSNRDLSVNRANSVVEQLRAAASNGLPDIQISATGYGEIAPVGCNVTEKGRATNRRVEVWISKQG
ncbi:phosphate ABC transporter substrate-binding/OmpA family protein [Actibacterium sp. 188UL27-1]|uniref:phosphate ABC transporter substrate-binding/OmpA family protein n=1 Tax=Actibacterium sp. 188UL27-1 TaxID=2786961 RepID=UPI00195A2B44|nr:phosphate ABC transporter substrate-binding/OmpA family protein [Actibacterium sp. 188UL27-1]MBM7067983.1 substrate-binding domain-containing protein [Actibacterium sp. 188UL27-1]